MSNDYDEETDQQEAETHRRSSRRRRPSRQPTRTEEPQGEVGRKEDEEARAATEAARDAQALHADLQRRREAAIQEQLKSSAVALDADEEAPPQAAQETSETASAMLAQAEAAYAAQATSAPAPAVQQGTGYLVDNALINALQSVRELSINEVDTKLNELANLLAMRGQAVNAQQYRRLTLLAVLQIKQDW